MTETATKTKSENVPQTQAEVNALTNPNHDEVSENAIFTASGDAAQRRAAALKAIKYQEYPRKRSRELIGKSFDLLDAIRGAIVDTKDGQSTKKDVVNFIIRIDGADFQTTKPLNSFTSAYLDYFESFEAGETVTPMNGYTFVEEGKEVAGNKPVILRKL